MPTSELREGSLALPGGEGDVASRGVCSLRSVVFVDLVFLSGIVIVQGLLGGTLLWLRSIWVSDTPGSGGDGLKVCVSGGSLE